MENHSQGPYGTENAIKIRMSTGQKKVQNLEKLRNFRN